MEQTQPKRHREHSGAGAGDPQTTKLQKTFHINEQQETNQDLQDFFINLYSDTYLEFNPQPGSEPDNDPNPNTKQDLKEDNDEKESVIRHLLEASDDELGIPAVEGGGGDSGDITGVNYLLDLCDGLWELEDEVANYHTLLQSELFM